MEGWIRLHRSLLVHRIFTNPKLLKVFLWCLLKARYKQGDIYLGRKKVALERGQFIFGRKKAAEVLGMPPSTLWSYMKILESDRCIDISSTSAFSIISIRNWDYYQLGLTGDLTTNGQRMDTNKNDKKDKNLYIANNKKYQYKERSGYRRSQSRRNYVFNPNDGAQSIQPTKEEEKTVVPQIKDEYREKLGEYIEREGIKNEDDVDPFKFLTETDYLRKRLKEIKKKGLFNGRKIKANNK